MKKWLVGGLGGPARPTYTPLRRPCSILDVDIVAINLINLLGRLLPLSPRYHIRDCTLVAMPGGYLRICCSPAYAGTPEGR
jgi:hypothetical protein